MPTVHPGNNKTKTNGIFKSGMKNYDYVCETINRMIFIREKVGITRAVLSNYLGKAANYISHIESHKITISLDFLAMFIKFFHIHPSIFFDDNFYKIFSQEEVIQKIKKFLNYKV